MSNACIRKAFSGFLLAILLRCQQYPRFRQPGR